MRGYSRTVIGSLAVAVIAVFSAVALVLAATIQTAVSLLAGTALIVPGTGTSNPADSAEYMENAVDYYIVPSCGSSCPAGGYTPVAVPYTAQFWPFPFEGWGGLQGAKWDESVQSGVVSVSIAYGATTPTPTDPVEAFGYSQGATVVSIFKQNLATLNSGTIPEGTFFSFIGNPNRANGGLFERLAILGTLPILDATFGQPTPTDTAPDGVINTVDTVFQYGGVGDMASNILNLPAVLNGLAGFWYVHGTYLDPRGRPPNNDLSGELPYGYTAQDVQEMISGCVADSSGPNCQEHGDTIYVTIPATSLPIIQPFVDLGASTGTSALINPIIALLQPALQTVIEAGYDRRDYSKPTPFQLIPRVDPIKFVGDLLNDIPEGINAAIATINDPNHTIPDLPPFWGTGSSAAAVVADDDAELAAATSTPEPSIAELQPAAPQTETTQPEPKVEVVKPAKRDLAPVREVVEAPEPKAEATEPKNETPEPKPEAVEPKVEATEPKAEVTKPKTRSHPKPVRELTKELRSKLSNRDEGPGKALSEKKSPKQTKADKPAKVADKAAA